MRPFLYHSRLANWVVEARSAPFIAVASWGSPPREGRSPGDATLAPLPGGRSDRAPMALPVKGVRPSRLPFSQQEVVWSVGAFLTTRSRLASLRGGGS